MPSLRNKVVEGSSHIHTDKVIIGNTTRCIDSACKGWLVDTILNKYWIRCLDPKHLNNNS